MDTNGRLQRLAGPTDAALLAALHARCFETGGGEAWDESAVTTLLATPGIFAFLVLAPADLPAGLVMARAGGGESEILTAGVLPEYRRQGLGAALIEAAAGHAASLGAQTLFLEVADDNEAAQGFYRSCGFKPVGRRAGYYRRESGSADAVVLRRDLGA